MFTESSENFNERKRNNESPTAQIVDLAKSLCAGRNAKFFAPEALRILAGGGTIGVQIPRPGWGAGPDSKEDMPSAHLSLHCHLIFSAKDRVAHMHKDWRGRLHAYMGGIVSDLGGIPETIGGSCAPSGAQIILSACFRWFHHRLISSVPPGRRAFYELSLKQQFEVQEEGQKKR
ncbi:MAG: hypothetical protein J2P52_16800 [Blastocatellia bacterium]|nr:hypothetical protein [Blastocatellia bacterium]